MLKSPPVGRGKRKPVPSLRAQRDNKIGDPSKENGLPVFAETRKSKKHGLGEADGRSGKRSK